MEKTEPPAGKRPSDSAAETVQVVLPNDTNPLGNLLGGRVMHWIDLIAAVVAFRHCNQPVVTASMDRVDFHTPIKLGWIVTLKARLNFVGRTSMEIGVEVYAEDPYSGLRHHTTSAIAMYVALDERGRPTPVPGLSPESEEERERYRTGQSRYRRRREAA